MLFHSLALGVILFTLQLVNGSVVPIQVNQTVTADSSTQYSVNFNLLRSFSLSVADKKIIGKYDSSQYLLPGDKTLSQNGIGDAVYNLNRILTTLLYLNRDQPIPYGTEITTFYKTMRTTASWTLPSSSASWTQGDAVEVTQAIAGWASGSSEKEIHPLSTVTKAGKDLGTMTLKFDRVSRLPPFTILGRSAAVYLQGWSFPDDTLPAGACAGAVSKLQQVVSGLSPSSIFPKGILDAVVYTGVSLRLVLRPKSPRNPPPDLSVGDLNFFLPKMIGNVIKNGQCMATYMRLLDPRNRDIGYIELVPHRGGSSDVVLGFNASMPDVTANETYHLAAENEESPSGGHVAVEPTS